MNRDHCVTGDSRIITKNGMGRAGDLYNMGMSTVVSVADFIAQDEDVSITQESSSVYEAGRESIVKITTEEGYSIRVSPNHQFSVDDDWKEAENVQEQDELRLLDHQGLFGKHGTYEEGIIQGILSENDSTEFEAGDFSISFKNISSAASSEVTQLYEWVSAISQHEDSKEIQMSDVKADQLQNALEQSSINRDELQGSVPDSVFTGSRKLVRGYLQAIFELRGSVNVTDDDDSMRLEFYGDDYSYLEDLQLLLINFGIKSSLEELPESSDRLIIEKESVVMFVENIGTLDASSEKSNTLSTMFEERESDLLEEEQEYVATVEDVETDGTEMVYGLTEPTTQSYIANGLISR
jgi:ribonucleoside-diphosphate reductase alpha chain